MSIITISRYNEHCFKNNQLRPYNIVENKLYSFIYIYVAEFKKENLKNSTQKKKS